MSVTLKEVSSLSELRAFIRFPSALYRGNPYWVPALFPDEYNTLRRDRNPAFEHCQARYWLAYREGRIVGRVAAILNRKHIEKWGQPYLRFGWLDFADDPQVSAALLGAVEGWARELGLAAVHGPLGFTDLDREGMLIEGFEELATLSTNYNYPYYPEHMQRLGYAKDTDWVEHEITIPAGPHPELEHMADVVRRRYNLHMLQARHKRELLPYAYQLFELIDQEYAHLYGTVPLSDRQVHAYVKQYFGFVQPDFVPVVLDADGRMVAFGLSLPSLSRALQKCDGRLFPFGFIHLLRALRRNDHFDLYLGAVRREYQGKGVNALLMHHMYQVYQRRGVRRVSANPQLEDNLAVQNQWKHFEHRQSKRRRVFIKHLDGTQPATSSMQA